MQESSQRTHSFQLILAAAEQLIREKGCRSTTLQDIIDRSGLSKGAIYHYVSGKDELFGLILQARMESANERFKQAVTAAERGDAAPPIQSISQTMMNSTAAEDVSSKIFTYLLSQIDNPKVAAIMQEIYDYTLHTASKWIEVGQQAGAIPLSVDARRMACLFTVFTYGLRVHKMVAKDSSVKLDEEDVFKLIFRTLQ